MLAVLTTEDPDNDLIVSRVAAMADQHGHVVSGVLVDPSQEALDAVVARIRPSLARVPDDSLAPTTAGVAVAPFAICSHNSKGIIHGRTNEQGEWEASYLPWRVSRRAAASDVARPHSPVLGHGCGVSRCLQRDPEAETKEVDCRTLPSLRRSYGINHFDIMQVCGSGGPEAESVARVPRNHSRLCDANR